MNKARLLTPPAALLLAWGLSSCSSLRLVPADFSWPVESAVAVSSSNTVEETRYGISFSVAALAAEEFQDSSALKGAAVRLLRGPDGFYFMTGNGFEHVYIFATDGQALALKEKIRVVPEQENGRKGLRNPALNQRPPYVELLDEGGVRVLLTSGGVAEQ